MVLENCHSGSLCNWILGIDQNDTRSIGFGVICSSTHDIDAFHLDLVQGFGEEVSMMVLMKKVLGSDQSIPDE